MELVQYLDFKKLLYIINLSKQVDIGVKKKIYKQNCQDLTLFKSNNKLHFAFIKILLTEL